MALQNEVGTVQLLVDALFGEAFPEDSIHTVAFAPPGLPRSVTARVQFRGHALTATMTPSENPAYRHVHRGLLVHELLQDARRVAGRVS